MDFITSTLGGALGGGEASGAGGGAYGSYVDVAVGGLSINKKQDLAVLAVAAVAGGVFVWLLKR